MQNLIIHNVRHKQASTNAKYYCLYDYYFLGLSRTHLATLYHKSKTTISSWITAYERDGALTKSQKNILFRKFDETKRRWILDLYEKRPVLYLDEARQLFANRFGMTISASSICNILHAHGMSWKALERRAVQIRQEDIRRYSNELNSLNWDLEQLLFLDEVAFANREILRNRGYGYVGESLLYRGEFRRKPRISRLCFLGQSGIVESFEAEGTFNRQKFFECCVKMALHSGQVERYPGRHSIWIMDGARIHCDKNIVNYLRSLGIVPIFLPAYCPFYNPIEVVFGLVKRYLKRHYIENDSIPLSITVGAALTNFMHHNGTRIFQKCGYFSGGSFDPSVGLPVNPS